MIVVKGKPRYHWTSPYTILETILFWKDWDNISCDTPWVEKWSNRLVPISHYIGKVLDFIHPEVDYVKIERHDTWSMDHTLAPIILPMLKQLQATKQGSPKVDDEDVPFEIRSYTAWPGEAWETDEHWHKRWDYVLAEMIWAFEQKVDDSAEHAFFDHSEVDDSKPVLETIGQIKFDKVGYEAYNARKQNGFRLFGKYYEGLWD
jgi:hypothetical protein